MSYSPTNWSKGDVVTSAKLNKLEQGVAAANVFLVTITDGDTEGYEADATFAEIDAAAESGKLVLGSYYGAMFFMSKVAAPFGTFYSGSTVSASDSELAASNFHIAQDGVTGSTENYTLTPAT